MPLRRKQPIFVPAVSFEILSFNAAFLFVISVPTSSYTTVLAYPAGASSTMASTFDFTKVDPRRYDISRATGALDFQLMVEEFMEAVKSSPGDFHGRDQVLRTFCEMVAEDSAWQLARNVVPEFRLSQYVSAAVSRRATRKS